MTLRSYFEGAGTAILEDVRWKFICFRWGSVGKASESLSSEIKHSDEQMRSRGSGEEIEERYRRVELQIAWKGLSNHSAEL